MDKNKLIGLTWDHSAVLFCTPVFDDNILWHITRTNNISSYISTVIMCQIYWHQCDNQYSLINI